MSIEEDEITIEELKKGWEYVTQYVDDELEIIICINK